MRMIALIIVAFLHLQFQNYSMCLVLYVLNFCAGVLVLKGVLAYPVEEVCLCGSAYQVIR